MTEKFQNKYRVPSARAQWWDYGENAAYFVTICTKNREHFFGEIVNRQMQLSAVGVIADVFWHEIKKHAGFVELDAFVVMPNHIHGIVIINKPDDARNVHTVHTVHSVKTGHALSLQSSKQPKQFPPSHPLPPQLQPPPPSPGQKRIRNQGRGTLSSIIGGYKSAVTNHSHRLGYDFAWQVRFHDHIVRDENEYQRIADYIRNNPLNWDNDKFFNQ